MIDTARLSAVASRAEPEHTECERSRIFAGFSDDELCLWHGMFGVPVPGRERETERALAGWGREAELEGMA